YNGLANRRLQPLGHSSVASDMPRRSGFGKVGGRDLTAQNLERSHFLRRTGSHPRIKSEGMLRRKVL
ncbi:MAG: hypothetical protein WAK69_03225, partial [Rhodoplanes sp.]